MKNINAGMFSDISDGQISCVFLSPDETLNTKTGPQNSSFWNFSQSIARYKKYKKITHEKH